jgi:hypothetical protein
MNAGTLKLLLHMYCHPPEVPFPFSGNPSHLRDCRHTLWLDNLIDREDELGIITDRGRVHVQALLAAPLPEQKWVSPL